MLFHEIYSSYYDIMSRAIARAIDGELTYEVLAQIVRDRQNVLSQRTGEEQDDDEIGEIVMEIESKIHTDSWQFVDKNYATTIHNPPVRPVTDLERRWIKTVLLDPRSQLFLDEPLDLPDVEPLFLPEDIVYYDRYTDGDPYTDPGYIERFRVIRGALHTHHWLRIHFTGRKGTIVELQGPPLFLEYADRDDKFRLHIMHNGKLNIVNLARVASVEMMKWTYDLGLYKERENPHETIVLEVTDERNALQRLLIQMSHYEKTARQTGERTYLVTITYDERDETDILIQILFFGPHVRILEPERMREQYLERIRNQMALFGMDTE